MKKSYRAGAALLAYAALVGFAPLSQAQATGDAAKGPDVFSEECADCHSLKEGKNKKGPSLFGVVGRASGSIADFEYSDSMRASNLTWSEDKLDAYLTHPKGVVAGGKMKYDGLDDEQARADLIAYLATLHN